MIDESKTNRKRNRNWVYHLLGTGFILIGLFYFLILLTGNLSTHNIFIHISNFTISWIFIYAGVQYIKKENLGSRLIACTIPTILFLPAQSIVFIILEQITKYTNTKLFSASWKSDFIGIFIVTTIAVWGILLIIHIRQQNCDFGETNIKHTVNISRLISFLSPGFAHIIIGRDTTDYSIYFIYFVLQYSLGKMAVVFSSNPTDSNMIYWFFIFISLLVWLSFILNEFSYIKGFKKSMDNSSLKQENVQELPPIIDINQDLQKKSDKYL